MWHLARGKLESGPAGPLTEADALSGGSCHPRARRGAELVNSAIPVQPAGRDRPAMRVFSWCEYGARGAEVRSNAPPAGWTASGALCLLTRPFGLAGRPARLRAAGASRRRSRSSRAASRARSAACSNLVASGCNPRTPRRRQTGQGGGHHAVVHTGRGSARSGSASG